jgi:hypothetical protein
LVFLYSVSLYAGAFEEWGVGVVADVPGGLFFYVL